MRAACRKYLDLVNPREAAIRAEMNFIAALGELRGAFGVYLGHLCMTFDVQPKFGLAALLPVPDVDETEAIDNGTEEA